MSTMISEESECYINKVMDIWSNVGVWKFLAVQCFSAMFIAILLDVYLKTAWLGVIFGVASLIFAVIGVRFGYFEIDNFLKVYMYEKMSEEEANFYRRCESWYIYKSNLVKYEHLLVG